MTSRDRTIMEPLIRGLQAKIDKKYPPGQEAGATEEFVFYCDVNAVLAYVRRLEADLDTRHSHD